MPLGEDSVHYFFLYLQTLLSFTLEVVVSFFIATLTYSALSTLITYSYSLSLFLSL